MKIYHYQIGSSSRGREERVEGPDPPPPLTVVTGPAGWEEEVGRAAGRGDRQARGWADLLACSEEPRGELNLLSSCLRGTENTAQGREGTDLRLLLLLLLLLPRTPPTSLQDWKYENSPEEVQSGLVSTDLGGAPWSLQG